MTKAPLGGERTGPNPTDSGKPGVKHSLLTYGRGIPLTVFVAPMNRNDCKLVEPTLDASLVRPPRTVCRRLCLDGGYDFVEVGELVDAYRFEAHTCRRDQAARRE